MGLEILEPNTCIRGCCTSRRIPIHLPPPSYSLSHPIARGAESVVYEAILDGKKVAVKKPILSTSEDIDKFHKELQLLCTLDHWGIAKLVGAHAKPPNYMFFFEYYESGNLAGKLHVDEWSPSIREALEIAAHLVLSPFTAKALQYLHNLGIVHRDVKPANILLDRQLQPHLADFGLAEYKKNLKLVSTENWKSTGKPTGGFHKRNMVGTLIYMAPEVLTKEVHTEKSDVYSFGITVNELLTGIVPYTDLRAETQAHTVLEMNYTEQQLTAAVVSEGLRPVLADIQSSAPASLVSLIERCWDKDPQNRPSFDDIVVELDFILEHDVGRGCMEKASGEAFISSNGVYAANFQTYQENISWFSQGKDFMKRVPTALAASTWLDSSDDHIYSPVLSWGSFASCGRRETMEDRHFLMPQLCDEKDIHIFAIFDGHRGSAAAEFSSGALPGFLQNLGSVCSPSDALFEAFIKTDVAFRTQLDSSRKRKGAVQKDWHPGCTAIAALIVRNKLIVANAGDCRTILCRSGIPYALSRDHVASCLEERERIIRAGGLVKWQVDTWRVGDAALQVMASDGLWDVVSEKDVVNIIRDTVKEAGMCSKRLATEAAERGSKDNITVIVIFLRPVSTAERIY
ncbi:protein kinase and PP2C-like domain-containing protein isoform X4 [Solanum lycopersicum]|uniref:protein kinase and PP2C-like domain-containing protein isoform X4 n=1 Tax=Solanum lycopersicum TaxID=4081 RepID=UPI000E1DCEE3|nr:protein kinase and PP2C-like domain-containing protein isoform X2 [Solanum lycopersicum]